MDSFHGSIFPISKLKRRRVIERIGFPRVKQQLSHGTWGSICYQNWWRHLSEKGADRLFKQFTSKISIWESHHQNIACNILQNETEIHKTYELPQSGFLSLYQIINICFRKVGIAVTQNPDDFVKQETAVDIQLLPENVTFSKWKRVTMIDNKQRIRIVQEELKKEEIVDLWNEEVRDFRGHIQKVQTQYAKSQLLKQNLPKNEVIVHMDLSGNYNCKRDPKCLLESVYRYAISQCCFLYKSWKRWNKTQKLCVIWLWHTNPFIVDGSSNSPQILWYWNIRKGKH